MIKAIEGQSQRIETDILNWTSFNDTGTGGEVLFTIPRKGVLAGDYVTLNLSMLKATATNKMPMCVGILGCIEEATLYYQNESIQTTRFAGLRNRIMNLREDPDVRSQKHNVEYGAFDLQDVREGRDGIAVGPATLLPGQFFYDAAQVGLDLNTIGGDPDATPPTGQPNVNRLNNADRAPEFDAAPLAADSANYRIRLSSIFPILSQIDLPLGLMNGQFTIRIRFADDVIGSRCVPSSTWTAANPMVETQHAFVPGNLIDPNTCNLVVDYIYYDTEEGETNPYDLLAASIAQGGLELVYTDLVNIMITAPNLAVSPAANQDLVISNRLNLNNQVVRNLIIAMPRQINTSDTTLGGRMNWVQGRYESLASQGLKQQGTLQLLVNNLPIFVNPLSNDAKIYTEVSAALGTTLKVNQGATSWFNQMNALGNGIDAENSYQMSSTVTAGGAGPATGNYRLNGFAYGKSTSWGEDALGVQLATGLCATEGYMGVDLTHTRANVVGAGTSVGTSPMQLIITKTATLANYAQQQVIVWCEAERIMRISNGELFVSGS